MSLLIVRPPLPRQPPLFLYSGRRKGERESHIVRFSGPYLSFTVAENIESKYVSFLLTCSEVNMSMIIVLRPPSVFHLASCRLYLVETLQSYTSGVMGPTGPQMPSVGLPLGSIRQCMPLIKLWNAQVPFSVCHMCTCLVSCVGDRLSWLRAFCTIAVGSHHCISEKVT